MPLNITLGQTWLLFQQRKRTEPLKCCLKPFCAPPPHGLPCCKALLNPLCYTGVYKHISKRPFFFFNQNSVRNCLDRLHNGIYIRLSLNVKFDCMNTQWAKHTIDFISSEFTFLLKPLLIWLV